MRPTLADLMKHARRYGEDGILESADHLTDEDREELRGFLRGLRREAKQARLAAIKAKAAR